MTGLLSSANSDDGGHISIFAYVGLYKTQVMIHE